MEAAWSDLRALVGAEHLRTSMLEDAVDDVLPQMVIEPGNPEEVAGALKIATGAGLQVIPRGGATKMDWGDPPRSGDLMLSTRRLNRVVEHAWGDMTATVKLGARSNNCSKLLPSMVSDWLSTLCGRNKRRSEGFWRPTTAGLSAFASEACATWLLASRWLCRMALSPRAAVRL